MKVPDKYVLLKIIDLHDDIHGVALHFNVGWRTVKNWYRWLEIDFRPPRIQLVSDCVLLKDKEIAAKYKVSEKTLSKWKKEYRLSKKDMRLSEIPSALSQEQNEIITGKLLGDGWIEKVNTKARCVNSCFGVEHCSAQLGYIQWCHSALEPFSLTLRKRSKNNPFAKTKHHKLILKSHIFNTKRCSVFTKLRKKWYPENFKIVPEDVELTWKTIAVWYCDDGSNILGKRCTRRHGILCTNNFSEKDTEVLVDKLQEKNIKCHVFFDKCRPMIHIHKDNFMHFLNQTRKHIPCECMNYKFIENAKP